MKINSNIEEYDVKSLSAIGSSVEMIKKSCKMLENGAEALQHNLTVANMHFNSSNMTKAIEIIKKFVQKLDEAEFQFDELLKSVNEFSEKLRRAWREW